MIERLELAGYKSIRKLDFELRPLNVLIGANGGGKSNLVSFFSLLRQMAEGQLGFYVGKQRVRNLVYGGSRVTQEIQASIHFRSDRASGSYGFQLSYAFGDRLIFEKESLHGHLLGIGGHKDLEFGKGHSEAKLCDCERGPDAALALEALSIFQGCRAYHFNDTSETAGVMQSCHIDDNRQLKGDFGNAAAFLYSLCEAESSHPYYTLIVRQIQRVAPFFSGFNLSPERSNEKQIALNWTQHGSEELNGPEQLSDGTLRMIGMIALLMQPPSNLPQFIILDEPELGLHPSAISHVAGLIRQASQSTQIIVATQSPLLVGEFEPQDVIVVERQPSGEPLLPAVSTFRRLGQEGLDEWLKEYSLGELWMKNVFGGQPVHE